MYVVNPISMSDNIMTSTIPEPDTSAGEVEWVAGTYATGDKVINTATHLIYESAIDNNTDDPILGVALTPPTWTVVGPTNKYSMFDDYANTISSSSADIVVDIMPNTIVNVVACFNVAAGSVNVKH